MKKTIIWIGVAIVLAFVGHALQVAGIKLSAQDADHATQKGQARLAARVGKTYWVRPNSASIYQFVRFGDADTSDSIQHGTPVQSTQEFTVLQLVARPDADSGTYRVRFADGSIKWMDDAAFAVHLAVPGSDIKTSPEIFDEDPVLWDARLHQSDQANGRPVLGPDPTKGARTSDPVFGMTEPEVKASNWGKPDNVVVVHTPTGVVDIWSYARGNFLGFRNGRLEEVLNTERGILG